MRYRLMATTTTECRIERLATRCRRGRHADTTTTQRKSVIAGRRAPTTPAWLHRPNERWRAAAPG